MMTPEVRRDLERMDRRGWKKISLEFGRDLLEVSVPPNCAELTMGHVQALPDPKGAMEEALLHPVGSPTLREIIRAKGKPP